MLFIFPFCQTMPCNNAALAAEHHEYQTQSCLDFFSLRCAFLPPFSCIWELIFLKTLPAYCLRRLFVASRYCWQVVFSGFCGGIARGLVEGPFEYVKVCRQLEKPWTLREVYNGSGATIFRNSFLFSFFVVCVFFRQSHTFRPWRVLKQLCSEAFALVVFHCLLEPVHWVRRRYLDLTKQVFGDKLGAFWTGALCANAAWLTVWPMDVIKTQVPSVIASYLCLCALTNQP